MSETMNRTFTSQTNTYIDPTNLLDWQSNKVHSFNNHVLKIINEGTEKQSLNFPFSPITNSPMEEMNKAEWAGGGGWTELSRPLLPDLHVFLSPKAPQIPLFRDFCGDFIMQGRHDY